MDHLDIEEVLHAWITAACQNNIPHTKWGSLSATSILTKIYFLKERVLWEQIGKGNKCSENYFKEFWGKLEFRTQRGFPSATPLLTKMLFFIDKVFLKYYNKISQSLYIVTNCCHKRYVYFPLPPLVQGRGFLRCAQIWLFFLLLTVFYHIQMYFTFNEHLCYNEQHDNIYSSLWLKYIDSKALHWSIDLIVGVP